MGRAKDSRRVLVNIMEQAQPSTVAAAAAAAASMETKQEAAPGQDAAGPAGGVRSNSKSSSSSSQPPSRRQISRSLRSLQDDVEEQSESLSALRKQMLWTMSPQVRSERLLTSRQLVLQGFSPAHEERNIEAAMAARDSWILAILKEHTHLPERRLAFKASHSTAVESLSRLSIVTMEEACVAVQAARALQHKRLPYAGSSITIKRQQAAFDRLVSAPAKSCMDLLTRREARFQGNLRPNWKDGTVTQVADHVPELLLKWVVNAERGRIKIFVTKRYLTLIEENIDKEIQRLQFGSAIVDQEKGKDDETKGKGKGKSKKGRKSSIPADTSSFRQEPAAARDGLTSLTFSRYPFNISIRRLEDGAAQPRQDGDADSSHMPVDQEGLAAAKRQADDHDHLHSQQIKRRSPTPTRLQPYQPGDRTGWQQDPWASAAAASHSSSSARPPRPADGAAPPEADRDGVIGGTRPA